MEYTYSSYKHLIELLRINGYDTIKFCDAVKPAKKVAIIRHDIDLDLQAAERIAEVEDQMGVQSTFFVMISSEYYNIFTARNMESLKHIIDLRHEIGLHFDITAYRDIKSQDDLRDVLKSEVSLLELGLGIKVNSFSWHIPRKELLGNHLSITDDLGLLNAYDPFFYDGFKYVSDSMMRWREPIIDYIVENKYSRFQILTHPIWYRNVSDLSDVQILEHNHNELISTQRNYLETIRPGYYK